MADDDYALAFKRLIDQETRGRFITDYLFDIRPVSDEKPFFHYYLKMENLKATYRVMGAKWQYFIEEGWLLPVLFVQVLVVSMVLVLLPLMKMKQHETAPFEQKPLRVLSYFALLGLAYLFIEIAFIQKMILGLENPSYAASTVIASVLICSGIGSTLSLRIKALRHTRVLLVLAAVAIISSLLLPPVIAFMGRFTMPMKIMLTFGTVMPAGILMGIPFPLGISTLSASRASSLGLGRKRLLLRARPDPCGHARVVHGYQFVLFAGAIAYLLAFLLIREGWRTAGNNDR